MDDPTSTTTAPDATGADSVPNTGTETTQTTQDTGSLLGGRKTEGTTPTGQTQATTTATTPTPAGTEAWYVGLYDQTGKINKAAFDRLPDHLKGYKDTFAKYDSVEALLGGMSHLATLAGKKGLAPLPDNAPDDAKKERAALMRQLNGTPEKPEGYGVRRPDDVPQEYWSDAYVNGALGILHKHNASPQLVKELIAFDTGLAKQNVAAASQREAQTLAQEQKALRDAFGPQFDDKVDLAKRAARTLQLDPSDPIFRNHKIVVAMARVGEMISEDRLVSGDSASNDGMSDRAKAKDIVNNAANPLHKAYHDPNDPRHDEAIRTAAEFNKRAAAIKRTQR